MKKKYMIILLCLLLITQVFGYFDSRGNEIDITPTIEVDKVLWYDYIFAIFSPSTLSTQGGPGIAIDSKAGDLYDISFTTRCTSGSGTQHRFTIGYSSIGSGQINNMGSPRVSTKSCNQGDLFQITLTNIKTPTFDDSKCGERIYVMIKHEIYTSSGWKIDTDGDYTEINGFEKIASLDYECTTTACDGLTGATTGSQFCSGKDVAVLQYTDIVRDGECLTNNRVLKNCALGCDSGECIKVINGYVLSNSACVATSYLSDESEPNNFYPAKSTCEEYLAISTQQDTSDNTQDTIIEKEYIIFNGEFCTTLSTSSEPSTTYTSLEQCSTTNQAEIKLPQNQDSSNDISTNGEEEAWYTKFWNWLRGLFVK